MKRFVLLLFCCILTVGCDDKKSELRKDYSEYGFTDISYGRDIDGCSEVIQFDADGTFHYWETCGNPVGCADLCEGYTYDETTNMVTILYPDGCEDSQPYKIEIINYYENILETRIDGEKVIFDYIVN